MSPSLGGLWAATAAGLGLALRTSIGRPASGRMLDPAAHGLPEMPALGLVLHRAQQDPGPACDHLAGIITEALRETLPGEWLVA